MTLRATFRASFFCLIFSFILFGCSEKKSFTFDKDDIRFVEFYCDYLQLSGVLGENGPVVINALNSEDIDELLVRHTITRESLNRKTEAYKKNPELWREVLLQVRENIRKKSAATRQ